MMKLLIINVAWHTPQNRVSDNYYARDTKYHKQRIVISHIIEINVNYS
jgi:hypothetical protein